MVKKSGFDPEVIVGVSRGGWIPARLMSDFLDKTDLASVGVRFYLEVSRSEKKPEINQEIQVDVAGKSVLVVDDVADTGESMLVLRKYLLDKKVSELRIATIYRKPWSRFTPDYYSRETVAWVIFPWEVFEAVRDMAAKCRRKEWSVSEMRRELFRIGVEEQVVKRCLGEAVEVA
jgi:hypoxanthine phosphoribosyltransferase